MSLPWIRFDTALPDNPKILALCARRDGHRAAFVYVCGLAYSGKHGTDGFLPRECLPRINGKQGDAANLLDLELWLMDPGGGGWIIPGWSEFQESNEETQKRRVRAQSAARTRWEKAGHARPVAS